MTHRRRGSESGCDMPSDLFVGRHGEAAWEERSPKGRLGGAATKRKRPTFGAGRSQSATLARGCIALAGSGLGRAEDAGGAALLASGLFPIRVGRDDDALFLQ